MSRRKKKKTSFRVFKTVNKFLSYSNEKLGTALLMSFSTFLNFTIFLFSFVVFTEVVEILTNVSLLSLQNCSSYEGSLFWMKTLGNENVESYYNAIFSIKFIQCVAHNYFDERLGFLNEVKI